MRCNVIWIEPEIRKLGNVGWRLHTRKGHVRVLFWLFFYCNFMKFTYAHTHHKQAHMIKITVFIFTWSMHCANSVILSACQRNLARLIWCCADDLSESLCKPIYDEGKFNALNYFIISNRKHTMHANAYMHIHIHINTYMHRLTHAHTHIQIQTQQAHKHTYTHKLTKAFVCAHAKTPHTRSITSFFGGREHLLCFFQHTQLQQCFG